MKILYVCPLAHLSGHPPFECTKETRILREHGDDVELLTFCGINGDFAVHVPQQVVFKNNSVFRAFRRYLFIQWVMRAFEYLSTIVKAEIVAGDRPIYLRDAEPFPHLIHITNFFARKKWVVSCTGGLYTTGSQMSWVYKILINFTGVNMKWWYKLGKNKIQYVAQNALIRRVLVDNFGDNVSVVPLGHRLEKVVEKTEARRRLSIPQDKIVLLSLGTNHTGKDIETLLSAVSTIPNVFLICAGPSVQIIGDNAASLVRKYQAKKVLIIDRQIGNTEKSLLFGASDWTMLSYHKNFTSTTSMLWESCAYLVPVIASSGNELESLVKYWGVGLTFEAENRNDLIRAIELARSAKDTSPYMVENCKEFIKAHSEDKWCQQTKALLR